MHKSPHRVRYPLIQPCTIYVFTWRLGHADWPSAVFSRTVNMSLPYVAGIGNSAVFFFLPMFVCGFFYPILGGKMCISWLDWVSRVFLFYREGSNFACCRVKMGLGIFNYQHYQMHFYLVHISNLTIFFHVLYVVCCIRISDFKYAIVIFSCWCF